MYFNIDWNKIPQDSYLRRIPAIQNIKKMSFRSNINIFVGENGTGKSTLLEAMAVASGFNPEGGTKNYRFSTYDSHSELCDAMYIPPDRSGRWGYFLRAETFYNVATKEHEYAVDTPDPYVEHLHERSHGESFLYIAQKHFNDHGLYFLDEPEAALSPARQMSLFHIINSCALGGSEFFIVTHSPILLALPNATIYSFDDGDIHTCTYEETSTYQIMNMFINCREQMVRTLTEDTEEK